MTKNNNKQTNIKIFVYDLGGKGHLHIWVPLSSEGATSSVTLFSFHKITPQPLNPTSLTQPTHTPPWSRGAVTDGGGVLFKGLQSQDSQISWDGFWNNQGGLSLCAWGRVHFLILLWSPFFSFVLFCYTFNWCKLENKGKPKNEADFWDLNKHNVGA